MLCVGCKNLCGDNAPRTTPGKRWRVLNNPLHALFCARCGTLLPPLDPADAMLSKLAQLSKFGLGADDRPILTSVRGGE